MTAAKNLTIDDVTSLGFETNSAFFSALSTSIQNIESSFSTLTSLLHQSTKRTTNPIANSFKKFKDQFEPFESSDADSILVLSPSAIPANATAKSIKEFLSDPPLFLCKIIAPSRRESSYIINIIGQTCSTKILLQSLHKVFPIQLRFDLLRLPSDLLQLKSPDSSPFLACVQVPVATVSPLLADFLNHFHLTSPVIVEKFLLNSTPATSFVYSLDTYDYHVNFSLMSSDDIENLSIFLVPPILYLDQLSHYPDIDSNSFAEIYNDNLSSSGRELIEHIWKLTLQEDISNHPSFDFSDTEFFTIVSPSPAPPSSNQILAPIPSPPPPLAPPRPARIVSSSDDEAVTMGALIGLLQQMQINTTQLFQSQLEQLEQRLSNSTPVSSPQIPSPSIPIPTTIVSAPAPDTSRQLAQFALLNQGKSRSGASTAVSLTITAIAPLIPLFHSREHIHEILCQNDHLALSVSLALMNTTDLQAIGPFVSLDNFKRYILETTFPDPEDESAPRSISVDTMVQLASLNFSRSTDKNISITCLQPEVGKAAPTITSLCLCVRNLRLLLVTIYGTHLHPLLSHLEDEVLTLCGKYSSSINPQVLITAINLRLASLRRAQCAASLLSPPTRITDEIIRECLHIDYLMAPDILQDQARRNAVALKETQALVASLQAKTLSGGAANTKTPLQPALSPPPPTLQGISPCYRWINKYDSCKNTLTCASRPARPHKFDAIDSAVKDDFEQWVRKYRISKK